MVRVADLEGPAGPPHPELWTCWHLYEQNFLFGKKKTDAAPTAPAAAPAAPTSAATAQEAIGTLRSNLDILEKR